MLADLQDTYSGKVFILGTGPSLKAVTDWTGISPTFGCNKLGYWANAPRTTFYACNYNKVIKGEVPDPNPTDHKFIVGVQDSFKERIQWPDWVWVTRGRDVPDTFGAMTLICSQIAYYLGFREIYLLGCDQTDTGSIFDPKDDRLRDAPLGTVFQDALPWWEEFRKFVEPEGVIYDCSGGRLSDVMPYKPLEAVLSNVQI